MSDSEFLKAFIEASRQRLVIEAQPETELLTFCQNIIEEFTRIAVDMLLSKRETGSLHSNKSELSTSPTISHPEDTIALQLFVEGLLKAIELCLDTNPKESDLRWLLSNLGMDLFEDAHSLAVEKVPQETKSSTIEPYEEQLQTIRQQTTQRMQDLIEAYANLDEKSKALNAMPLTVPIAKADSPFQRVSTTQSLIFRVTKPLRKLKEAIWSLWEKRALLFSEALKQEQSKFHPGWTSIAWLGPFLIWLILNSTLEQALPFLPFLPWLTIVALLLSGWVQNGLFHLRALPLLGLVSLNTSLLFILAFDFKLVLLANMLLLLGLLVVFILEQECQAHQEELDEQKEQEAEIINPNRMYAKLGEDRLKLIIGSDLVSIADSDQEGELIGKLAKLREDLTKELGYIFPNIRIMDSEHLAPNEYQFQVRGNLVASGKVYPERYRVSAKLFAKHQLRLPEKVILDIDPVQRHENVYWLSAGQLSDPLRKPALKAADVLTEHIKAELIKHVDHIIDYVDVMKLRALVSHNNTALADELLPKILSIMAFRKTIVNLIREKVCIRDILFVYERLADFAYSTKDPDTLSEKMRTALCRQICLSINEEKQIAALKLSPSIEKQLNKLYQQNTEDTLGVIDPVLTEQLLEKVRNKLQQIEEQHGHLPVILCPSSIRLPLFRILSTEFPFITVLAYHELIPDIQVEYLGEL